MGSCHCPALRLAIEIDGDSHESDVAAQYDQHRQEYLESLGIRVLRFTNQDIHQHLDTIVEQIAHVSDS